MSSFRTRCLSTFTFATVAIAMLACASLTACDDDPSLPPFFYDLSEAGGPIAVVPMEAGASITVNDASTDAAPDARAVAAH